MHPTSLLCTIAVLCAQLASQQLIETFSYPNGPVPGWTVRSGSWTINNGRMVKTGAANVTDFITKDGYSAKNCVLDLEVFYSITPGLQLGGVICRHPGLGGVPPMVYGKAQDNGTSGFSILYLYDTAGNPAFVSSTFSPAVRTAYLRLVTLDATSTLYCDTDKDGVYDKSLSRSISGALGAGLVGCVAYQLTELDNFKFYDGVLVPAPNAVPKVGTTYNMRFATPAPQFTPWVAGFALKNTGIPLGTRVVPLALDPLLDLTLANAGALGLAGIVDANGDGTLAFPIPNNAALVGFTFYAAAVTLDATMPFNIGVISQDLRVVLEA